MVGYLTSLGIFIATYALFSLGLNLQWGFTGLINFGHIAFMTLGAYATVLLSLNGVPIWIATLVGCGCAAFLGLLIGLSTLRLREDYLAIVTIGVSEVVRLIALNEEELTKGTRGVYGYPLPLDQLEPNLGVKLGMIGILTLIFGLSLWKLGQWIRQVPKGDRSRSWQRSMMAIVGYVLCLGFALTLYGTGLIGVWDYSYKAGLMWLLIVTVALVFWRLEALVNSPWGRVLKAIREDEEVAKALGKDVFRYKLQAFMIGGAIAGLAGSFYAWQLTFINPDGFIPLITFQAWIIVVLGGSGNNVGTLLGAVIFWAYDAATRFLLPSLLPFDDARLGAFRIMVIGLLMIVLMMWRPQGILGKKEELTLGR
ncbi:MAG: branched-chain amino acid ABC transporter permease [Thermosynechococcaceae cyanobacterium]